MTILDDLLTAAGRVDDPQPETLDSARRSVHLAAAALADATTRATPPRHRRRLVLATAVAAGAAAVIAIPVVTLAGHGPSTNAQAATVLRLAGSAAGNQEGGWPDATYWRVASTYVRDGRTYQRDIWVAHHGQSVLRDTGLPDGDGVVGAPAQVVPAASTFAAGGTSLTWDQLYALPTDAAQLAAALRGDLQGAGSDPTSELFVAVGDLLRESPAPPALRKALYDVAATIPGVRVTGDLTDGAGRSGTGVERDGETYVIDLSTGAMLADGAAGWSATYVDQGPSDSAPPLPAK
jgi:hypothetical protein